MEHQRFAILRQIVAASAYFLISCFALANPASDASPNKENRSLSPYFFVKSEDAAVDQLPLKATRVDVNVAGVIAEVTVTQTYANTGKIPLEATYVFPASTRAAVNGMTMTIGERVVVAKINKREDARRQYEEARQQGKSASLLEQQRPNVFQMNLANIMPGDEIKVEMRYTELIVPEAGVYEFVYPTVVGPRYSNKPADRAGESERWVANPTLRPGEAPSASLDIQVNIAAGMPIQAVSSPSHQTSILFEGKEQASVRLDTQEAHGGNRDFILRYRLAGEKIASGLLLSQGKEDNYFLLTMQPPARVAAKDIPGREYLFIVDISGSMNGFPIAISKELLRNLIGGLRERDRFNVLLFAGSNQLMAEESLPATQDNISKAIALIERHHGGGGTELLPALRRALAMKASPGYARSIVIATDGYVTVEEEVFEQIRKNLDRSNVFTFGIGTSVNRHLLEGMARVGMGEPVVITNAAQAPAAAERFRKMIESPLLTGVQVRFEGFDAYDVEPAKVADIFAERPLLLFGKWRGEPSGKILVSGTSSGGPFAEEILVGAGDVRQRMEALRYLWARHRITLLSDYNALRRNDARIAEVTDLGLKHNLLTAYTSFVAIDSQVRNEGGAASTVAQPVPLPQGVSAYAVSGIPMPSAPTPGRVLGNPMGSKITLAADVLFAFNEVTLSEAAKARLDDFAKSLAGLTLEVMLAVGHSDRLEKETEKRKISELRAAAVKAYLVAKGIDTNRVYIEAKSARQPKTGDACKGSKKSKALVDCLQPDRRVDIEVIAFRK